MRFANCVLRLTSTIDKLKTMQCLSQAVARFTSAADEMLQKLSQWEDRERAMGQVNNSSMKKRFQHQKNHANLVLQSVCSVCIEQN